MLNSLTVVAYPAFLYRLCETGERFYLEKTIPAKPPDVQCTPLCTLREKSRKCPNDLTHGPGVLVPLLVLRKPSLPCVRHPASLYHCTNERASYSDNVTRFILRRHAMQLLAGLLAQLPPDS